MGKRAGEKEIRQKLDLLVDQSTKGDGEALKQLQEATSKVGYYEYLIDQFGDLARHAEHTLISALAGDNLLQVKGLAKRLKDLKKELAGPEPSPLELILVDRICCCWLAAYHADMNESHFKGATFAQGEYYQRRHDRAHRRFLSACKALAQVRRLLGPNVQLLSSFARYFATRFHPT